jgi:hypothetical protein
MSETYQLKYLKYKNKYLELKKNVDLSSYTQSKQHNDYKYTNVQSNKLVGGSVSKCTKCFNN